MDYYAEPIRTTKRVPIVLNSPDDWWNWDSHIKGLAMAYGVKDILLKETPRPTEPVHPDDTPNQESNDRRVNRWKREYKKWEKVELGLAAIWREIDQTVAQKHLMRITDQSESIVERYWKLKEKLEPKREDQISHVTSRYNRLLLKPANQNVEA